MLNNMEKSVQQIGIQVKKLWTLVTAVKKLKIIGKMNMQKSEYNGNDIRYKNVFKFIILLNLVIKY